MNVDKPPLDDESAIRTHLRELAAVLRNRGLRVLMGTSALAASPPARRRTQYLLLEVHEDRSRHWYRAWAASGRDALLRTEYLCPAEEIGHAADTMTRLVGG